MMMNNKHQARLALRARLRRSCPNLSELSLDIMSDAQIEIIEMRYTWRQRQRVYRQIIDKGGEWHGCLYSGR